MVCSSKAMPRARLGLITAMRKIFLATSLALAALSTEAMASERFQYFKCEESNPGVMDTNPYLYVALDRTEGRIQLGGGEWSEKHSAKWRGNKVEYKKRGDGYRAYIRLNLTSGYIIYTANFRAMNYSYKFEGECRMTSSR